MLDKQGFAEWQREKELSNNTICTYRDALTEFESMYGELSKNNTVAYKKWLIENRSPKTVAIRLTAINQYCTYAGMPKCAVKTVKTPKKAFSSNVITKEEFDYLSEKLIEDKDWKGYVLVQCLGKTGARINELVRFKVGDIRKGEVSMYSKGKIRTIYIPDVVRETCLAHVSEKDDASVFPSRIHKSKHMSPRAIDAKLRAMGEKYGIRTEVMHAHSFRHMFATEFLKNNTNLSLLADIMGHESVNTTAIYLTLSKEQQRKELSAAMV